MLIRRAWEAFNKPALNFGARTGGLSQTCSSASSCAAEQMLPGRKVGAHGSGQREEVRAAAGPCEDKGAKAAPRAGVRLPVPREATTKHSLCEAGREQTKTELGLDS